MCVYFRFIIPMALQDATQFGLAYFKKLINGLKLRISDNGFSLDIRLQYQFIFKVPYVFRLGLLLPKFLF